MVGPTFIEALAPGGVWRFIETTMSPRGSDLRQQILWDTSLVFRSETSNELWFQHLEDQAAWYLPVAFASRARRVTPGTWSIILAPEDFDREQYYTENGSLTDKLAMRWLIRGSDGSFPNSGQPFPVQMTLIDLGCNI